MYEVALSLGTNSGDRFYYMRAMEASLKSVLAPPVRMSDLFETEPLEVDSSHPWFLNRIICGHYQQSAEDLLKECFCIERSLGRDQKGMRAKRTADIDILLFGNEVVSLPHLSIPHPALLRRRFILEGLVQLLPATPVGPDARTVRQHYQTLHPSLQQQNLRIVPREEYA